MMMLFGLMYKLGDGVEGHLNRKWRLKRGCVQSLGILAALSRMATHEAPDA